MAPKIFTPGQQFINQSGFMRGHGTYVDGDDLKAFLAGVMEFI